MNSALCPSIKWLSDASFCVDDHAAVAASNHQNSLTKPQGSLGRLEEVVIRLAGLQGQAFPSLTQTEIAIFAADHGVAAEPISAYPQSVTREMIRNFSEGGAAISVLAQELQATLTIYNLGTCVSTDNMPGVINRVIAPQTTNMLQGAAMSQQQLALALNIGRDAVPNTRVELFIGGEMGIGNTTAATAIACALLKESAEKLTGIGTGIDQAGVQRKTEVINRAIHQHRSQLVSPLAILQHLGGFEIAALTGAYITCAQRGIPVLVDGFICTVAALVAVSINPSIAPWLILSHHSSERAYSLIAQHFNHKPLLDLAMRLGEGSGAAVTVPLLRVACTLHRNMATFAQANVSEKR